MTKADILQIIEQATTRAELLRIDQEIERAVEHSGLTLEESTECDRAVEATMHVVLVVS